MPLLHLRKVREELVSHVCSMEKLNSTMRCPETFVSPVLFKSLCQNSGIQCMSQNCIYLRISRDDSCGKHGRWLLNFGSRNFPKTLFQVSLFALHRLDLEAWPFPQLPPAMLRGSCSERQGRFRYRIRQLHGHNSSHVSDRVNVCD